ncbi:MAG: thioredoxin [Candidatus Kariarchaeaceae archaeon]|jgi:thioredoxin 1
MDSGKIDDQELATLKERRMKQIMSTTPATKKPIVLSEETFDEMVKNTPIMLVDFWAEWCGPCKMVGPILDELAGEYEGKVWVGKVDTESNRQIAMKYGASSIPTFWAFKEGIPVGRFVGAQPKAAFVDVFKQLIELDMDKVREEMEKQEKGN